MSAELRQLREQRDDLDALAEALRTRDGWLAYRAEVLHDHLLELEGRSTGRASAVERVRTALIDLDEALQQAREDLERARSVAADWEGRWSPSGLSAGGTAWSSRRRDPGEARPRRGRGRPRGGPMRPRS
jgi:chromosome segregation ATPase